MRNPRLKFIIMSDLTQLLNNLKRKEKELTAFRDKRWSKRVGEIAISHFKKNFRDGGWNDNGLTKWKKTRRQEHGGKGAYYNRSPLLSQSNNLQKGFTYQVETNRVVVSNNLSYAGIHNEGGTITQNITPRMRRYAWARFFESAGITKEDAPDVRKRKEAAMNEHDRFWKRLALTKKQTKTTHIPQRQFAGHSRELHQKISDYTDQEIMKILNS